MANRTVNVSVLSGLSVGSDNVKLLLLFFFIILIDSCCVKMHASLLLNVMLEHLCLNPC